MEFHVSRKARDRYQFDQSLFSLHGNVVFANFHAARIFAQKINIKRDTVRFPEQAVRAGQINAMGMIDEIMHFIVTLYRDQKNPQVMSEALNYLSENLGKDAVDRTLRKFADEYPTVEVYKKGVSVSEYLLGDTDGTPNRQIVLEEMLLLWLANNNPAFSPFLELFDDTQLSKETAYVQIMASLHEFMDTQSYFGPENQNLIDMLRSPAIAVPHSLTGQLEYIREKWASILGHFLFRLLGSLDLIKEEEKSFFQGPGPTQVLDFRKLRLGEGGETELEHFSLDQAWMPELVVIAKNTYVWLDQLSRKYQRDIHRLDQIPNETLDELANWGFSGLWLIGLWERSKASENIKKLCGNPDAVASAYSLSSYEIASDIGGEAAYRDLRDRAWQRGIRLASDMVPNHMGIDSQWVIDHPDWFISLNYSPFPSYSFNGPDLSRDPRVGLYLEDHYYDRSDAAVVFKRVDRWSNNESYIYHGNDGTSMPWNDTAQLNYLNPQVREAVIQTILEVARRFPIIRFDAAMTLAKKHYQRLWFPEPGTGGAIPSRADFGLTKDQFDAAMPLEFWREVVDRVAQEAPGTLLLAEAFWMMEGYFVRTLGMHRVYNSAFMNMLRNEENQKYRTVIKNTLEFDPEILKRYVNFMNNPDERTAVDQFGKGDKYFGICLLMATLPGLPMFGHGQIEGFSEKYGMEFRHAYWNEQIDSGLVERHKREIFPLLHKRAIFAGVENFLLYDLVTPDGCVSEDVFAYSNGIGDQRALVIYNNRFSSTQGWIRKSVGYSTKTGKADQRVMQQKTLADGLRIHAQDDLYMIFRDTISGLEYIRHSQEISDKGLFVELNAYKYYVFTDFRGVRDEDGRPYGHLHAYLNGRGVPSMDEALKELFLQPIHYPLQNLVNGEMLTRQLNARIDAKDKPLDNALLHEFHQKTMAFLHEVQNMSGGSQDISSIARNTNRKLETILYLQMLDLQYPYPASKKYRSALKDMSELLKGEFTPWIILFGWVNVHQIGKVLDPLNFKELSISWIDEWQLGRLISLAAQEMGASEATAWQIVATIKLLTSQQDWYKGLGTKPASEILQSWLKDDVTQRFLGINRYQDILWFNHEAYLKMVQWMMAIAIIEIASDEKSSTNQVVEAVLACYDIREKLIQAEENSDFQLEKLLNAVQIQEAVEYPKPALPGSSVD